MALESEIKFTLDPADVARLLRSKLVKTAQIGKKKTRKIPSTYFDTRQHALRKQGAALRIRQLGNKQEQTLKVEAEGPLGMQNYDEWSVEISGSTPDLSLFRPLVLQRLPRSSRHYNLQAVFTTDIKRISLVLKHRKTQFEMAVDSGFLIADGGSGRSEAVSEVEFELLKGDPLDMLDFLLDLSDSIDLQPLHVSKAQRGYALSRSSLRPRPTKARKVHLPPGVNVGEAFQFIVGESLKQLFANEIPTMQGAPGGVHQARVSIRRIRAALRAFKKHLPYDKRKAFNGEFRWFQLRLAAARDWHVFLSETLPGIRKQYPNSRINLDRLRKLALRERRRATNDAMEVFRSRRYTRLLLQFQRWVIGLQSENPEMFKTAVLPFAISVLKKTRRDFLVDPRPLSRMSADDRHNLRKRGKKARYATEFFAHLWQGREVHSYLETMERIQDRLGEANDAEVARHLLALVPPSQLKPSTLALVQDWSELRIKKCIQSGQLVWRKFQRLPTFWHAANRAPAETVDPG